MTGPLLPVDDELLLDAVRSEWERRDPVPSDLAERMVFAVALEGLEADVAVLAAEMLEPVGARGVEPARTLTFTSENASVMVTLTPRAGGRFRLDGWVAPAGRGRVELRRGAGLDGNDTLSTEQTPVDDQGRFACPEVSGGLVQLVFVPDPGGPLSRPVAAPPVRF